MTIKKIKIFLYFKYESILNDQEKVFKVMVEELTYFRTNFLSKKNWFIYKLYS